MKSEWFRRGWMLQELLAPRTVVFLNREWQILGHKCQVDTCDLTCHGFGSCLNAKISIITGIPNFVLDNAWKPAGPTTDLNDVESYMRKRKTERLEDRAYCLLGLLGVNLVPIYGERENAWTRLVDELGKRKMTRPRQRRRKQYESDSSLVFGWADPREVPPPPSQSPYSHLRNPFAPAPPSQSPYDKYPYAFAPPPYGPPPSQPPYYHSRNPFSPPISEPFPSEKSSDSDSDNPVAETVPASTRSLESTRPYPQSEGADRRRSRDTRQGSDDGRHARRRVHNYQTRRKLEIASASLADAGGGRPSIGNEQVDVKIDELLPDFQSLVTVLE